MVFERGTLWERIVRQSRRSLDSGDREPLASEVHEIIDDGETFAVHVTVGRDRKWRLTKEQKAAGVDPFMPPYDDELFVADLSETHVAMLNKFNVIDHHLLIVTRAFEPQQSVLTDADFSAVWACLREFDALAFYNSGSEAGASQEHKHLQVVARSCLGTVPDPAALPLCGRSSRGASRYAFARRPVPPGLSGAAEAGPALTALYRTLLREMDLLTEGAPNAPYNLLLTRECMVVVPRTRAGWKKSGVNGMGYAGSFLLHGPADLEWLSEVGPLAVLARAGRPPRVPA
jgi:ATP adenylyltransferase